VASPLRSKGGDLRFQRFNPVGQVGNLLEEHAADIACQIRNVGVGIFNDSFQARQITDPLWCDIAELVEMRPERIHGLGALLHKLLARPEGDGTGLLFLGLGFDEPHGRTQCRFDDCFRVGSIVFLPLQKRFDVMRCDQPDAVPMGGQFPRPVMRAGTRLHRHLAGRMIRHEPRELKP
jgi:hypothetical protein